MAVVSDYLQKLHDQTLGATDIHQPLWREYFTRLRQFAEAGYARRLDEARSVQEFELFRRMERNLASFAAHKQNALTDELRRLMVDRTTGIKRTLPEFQTAALDLLKQYNDTWLRVEATHATIAAQQIESWQEIQQRKDLYPYLRYETAGDDRVRPKHKLLDGAVHPVDSEFWDVNYPPNGWRCRCKVIQVDEPGREMQVNFQPDKGFRHNVGKTGLIVGPDHAYFDVSVLDGERITKQAFSYLHALDQAATMQKAISAFAGKELPWQDGRNLRVDDAVLRRIHRSNHPSPDVRDKMLAVLDIFLPELVLMVEQDDMRMYLITLLGERFFWHMRQEDALSILADIAHTP